MSNERNVSFYGAFFFVVNFFGDKAFQDANYVL